MAESVLVDRMITVSVTGNLSAGKTTAIEEMLRQNPNVYNYAKERVDMVLELLDEYYAAETAFDEAKKRLPQVPEEICQAVSKAALVVQTAFLNLRLCEQIPSNGTMPHNITVSDRDAFTDPLVFPRMLLKEGKMSKFHFGLYKRVWRANIEKHTCLRPALVIYLQTSPAVARQRWRKRKSNAEAHMREGYLDDVHAQHEVMIAKLRKKHSDIAVETIDCDALTPDDVAKEMHRIIQKHVASPSSDDDTGSSSSSLQ